MQGRRICSNSLFYILLTKQYSIKKWQAISVIALWLEKKNSFIKEIFEIINEAINHIIN